MRIARIARPAALRDASVSAQTSASINELVTNPRNFYGVDVYLDKARGDISQSRNPCVCEFIRNSPKNVNRANLFGKIRKSANLKPILRCRIYCICANRSVG